MNYSRVRRKKQQKSRRKNRYTREELHRLGISAKAKKAAELAAKAG